MFLFSAINLQMSNTPQVLEPETDDQRNYREISTRLTLLDIEIDSAARELNDFRYNNPIPTTSVVSRGSELEGRVNDLLRQRGNLLPIWAELKGRVLAGG